MLSIKKKERLTGSTYERLVFTWKSFRIYEISSHYVGSAIPLKAYMASKQVTPLLVNFDPTKVSLIHV